MDVRELIISELNPPLNITFIREKSGLGSLKNFFKREKVTGFDVETNMTKTFYHRKMRTMQFGNRNEQYVIDLLAFAGSPANLSEGQGSYARPEWFEPVREVVQPVLESNEWLKIGYNLQFDYETTKWSFGIRSWNFYDCFLAEKVIHCGAVHFKRKDFWALDDAVRRYAGLSVDKSLQKSFDLESELTEDQIVYAALDTRLVFAVKSGQSKIIEKAALVGTVKTENDAIPAFGDMHLNGFYLDSEKWTKLENTVKEKHAVNVKELDNYFVGVVGDKSKPDVDLEKLESQWRNEKDKDSRKAFRVLYQGACREIKAWEKNCKTYEGEAAINYGSSTQLLFALRKLGFDGKELPDTNDKTLERFSDEPVIKAIQNYRETSKLLSTYGESFLDNIDPDTGRIHSKYDQLGADTGRTSSSKPNLQNIPKTQDFRDCFTSDEGWVYIVVDMSGAELRIMAEASGEQTWIDAFNAGWDVHSMGAEMMYRQEWADAAEEGCAYASKHQKCKCKKHKYLRDKCKATNFKVAYGGEDLSDDLKITKTESDDILKLWRKTFGVLNKYLITSGRKAVETLESRTLGGRRRLFVKPNWDKCKEKVIEQCTKDGKNLSTITQNTIARKYAMMYSHIDRQGKNTPIQGTNGDIAKKSVGCGFHPNGFGYMWHRLEPDFGAKLVGFVHDEFIVACKPERAEECKTFISECIKVGGSEYLKKLDMESEAAISDRWKK